MANILGTEIPISFGLNKATEQASRNPMTIIWVLLAIVLIIIGAIAIFLILNRRTYNRKIIVFENIAGLGYQVAFRDRARLIKIGDGGEEILFLKKKKAYRTAYGKKMGKNTYWFAIGQDGYWYNITIGDLDAKMGMLDIEPIDRDMRYMHVAVRKNIQDRYHKVSFMEKYGTILMSGIFLLIMLVGVFILLGKIGKISEAISGAVESADKVNQGSSAVLSALNNLLTGGNGIKPTEGSVISGLVPATT